MAQRRKTIIRSRAVRARVLNVLGEIREAVPGMGMATDELIEQAQSDSPFAMDAQELQGEVLDLRDHKLIEIDQHQARITSGGADFVKSGLPWDRIDTFSGEMK